ncbi:traB domain-containing protein-like [Trifolium pratense]|uniref:TraB domain-containing protein-like n=1 Tax=Trifolium pratense TaxID=57577 RepID=A0A2K3PBV5_TRIPR|nr:traB domain-containing protein-like [Trifolium pratense]
MEAQPPESNTPAVEEGGGGEDFIQVHDLKMESLSDSMVRIDHPSDAVDAASSPSDDPMVIDRRPVALPVELSRNVMMLSCESSAVGGVCDVYLVGTAHVSEAFVTLVGAAALPIEFTIVELVESSKEVQAIVNLLKPESVFLELCSSRVRMLTMQNLKVASQLEVFPGAEFRVAYEEALKYGGRVILGDRPVQLKEMGDNDMLTLVIQEMSKEYPTLMETLGDERDQYMSSTLLQVASESRSVVAVVGKGHLQGIKKNWKQPIVMQDLLTIPSPKPAISALRVFTSVGVGVAGVAIISGIYLSCKK